MVTRHKQQGFTLIEMMIVVFIIGIIAGIAWPNYQRYVVKTKRTDMMTTLQGIGSQLQAKKLSSGSYNSTMLTGLTGDYPKQDAKKLYTVTATLDNNSDSTLGDWKLTAAPITTSQVKDDGTLTLDFNGIKCRGNSCGTAQEWNN